MSRISISLVLMLVLGDATAEPVGPSPAAVMEISSAGRPEIRGAGGVAIEASGVYCTATRVFVAGDETKNGLFVLDLPHQGAPLRLVPFGGTADMNDLEALAGSSDADGSATIFALTSLSNNKAGEEKPKRQQIARFRLAADGAPASFSALSAAALRAALSAALKARQVANYAEFNAEAGLATDRFANVEALARTAEGDFFAGLRNPVADGKAIVFMLERIPAAFDQGGNVEIKKEPGLVLLDLHGLGVADLAWDEKTKGLLIAAGGSDGPTTNPSPRRSELFWWSGRMTEAPILFARVKDMNIEGLCRIPGSDKVALVSDDELAGGGRRSLLTLIDFVAPPH